MYKHRNFNFSGGKLGLKMAQTHCLFFFLSLNLLILGTFSATFSFTNNCDYTVWPGLLSGAGTAPLSTTGFVLVKGQSQTVNVPSAWSGRMWGRTQCSQDSTTGKFTCGTAECGSGTVECSGGATPPATLAEFTLNGAGGQDFYDVSLVDGYNLPMVVVPQGGTGTNCSTTGCAVDLNGSCPTELRVTSSEDGSQPIACKSACEAFGDPQYCCSGAYGSPDTCKPSQYSEMFKAACPRAYSYAYDDKTSTFTCGGSPDYLITFCPTPNTSQKSSTGGETTTNGKTNSGSSSDSDSDINSRMVYEGLSNGSGTWAHVVACQRLAAGVAIATAIYWQIHRHI